jgi:hypothetical protein
MGCGTDSSAWLWVQVPESSALDLGSGQSFFGGQKITKLLQKNKASHL